MRYYTVCMHREHDKDLIEYVESAKENGHSISQIFKVALDKLMK